MQLFNPKVAIFFLAYFPQFLDRGAPILPQTLLLGSVYIVDRGLLGPGIRAGVASLIAGRLKRSARAAAAWRAAAR